MKLVNFAMKQIPLTCGKVAIVDDTDYPIISQFKWRAKKQKSGIWYAATSVRYRGVTGKRPWGFFMHNLILGFRLADHKDGNGLDNRRGNLREAWPYENSWNRRRRKTSIAPFKGITRIKTCKSPRYQASIMCRGKYHYLGLFKDPKQAAKAYDDAALKMFGDFALTNLKLGLL